MENSITLFHRFVRKAHILFLHIPRSFCLVKAFYLFYSKQKYSAITFSDNWCLYDYIYNLLNKLKILDKDFYYLCQKFSFCIETVRDRTFQNQHKKPIWNTVHFMVKNDIIGLCHGDRLFTWSRCLILPPRHLEEVRGGGGGRGWGIGSWPSVVVLEGG